MSGLISIQECYDKGDITASLQILPLAVVGELKTTNMISVGGPSSLVYW